MAAEALLLGAATLQFGFNHLKEDLGWHHRKIGPQDDCSSRGDQLFGHANITPIATCQAAPLQV
ncbi:hypothetical protein [Bradyrhizobium sp. LA7.1]|uniref:hypothetical protein n=1 Tax=Bradyrhizobium sp. LA7.1 TaxID=3156324 RepID=UPI003394D988